MRDWIFMWASNRSSLWDNVTNNMNLALTEWFATPEQYFPANIRSVSEAHLDRVPNKEALSGQMLDQFEAETFKYVIEAYGDKLRMKENLRIPIMTDTTNSRIIDLDEVALHLQLRKWVALGVVLSNVDINDKTLIAKSFYYTRDPNTLKIINLSGDNHPHEHDHLPVVTYAVFKQTSDPSIYTVTVNPNLISISNIETGVFGYNRVTTLNTFEDGIDSFFIKPKIVGAKVMNGNIIFAENDFRIVEYGESGLHIRTGKVPQFGRTIDTNYNVAEHEGELRVSINQNIGYLSLTYDIDGLINIYDDRSKAGKHKVDYLVIRG